MMNAKERAVTLMANAAWNGSKELKITHNQYDGIARKMLDALLAATQEEPCPTCLGTHTLRLEHGSTQCPNCTDGRVPGAPLVILGPEQVGWGHYFGRDSESQWQFVNDHRETRLYRAPEEVTK